MRPARPAWFVGARSAMWATHSCAWPGLRRAPASLYWLAKSAAKQGLTAGLVYYGCGACTAVRAAPPHLTGPFSCPFRGPRLPRVLCSARMRFPGFWLGGLPACPAVFQAAVLVHPVFLLFVGVPLRGSVLGAGGAARARAQPAPHRMHGLRGVVYTYRPCSLFPAGWGEHGWQKPNV